MAARKPSSSLSKYLDSKKIETRLIGPIERHLLARTPEFRRQDIIHPSDLCKKDFCARATYYKVTGQGVVEDKPGLRLQSIFDEGHAIHHKWQNWIREMGSLYGKWECLVCSETFYALSPTVCLDCGSPLLKYNEVPLWDDELLIGGHADGWVQELGPDYLIEVKSMGTGTIRMEAPALLRDTDIEGAWKNIRRPFPTHIRQGLLYLELGRRMVEKGLLKSFPDEIVYVYELKANQAYKEFAVRANPEIVKDMLDAAFDIQHAVRVTKTPPPCSQTIGGSCKACAPYEVAA